MSDAIEYEVSTVYEKNYKALRDPNYDIIVNQGGARSGKTFSIIQNVVTLADQSETPLEISITSPSIPHIKRGVFRDFKKIMNDWEMYDDKRMHHTDFIYTFPNNTYVEFFSLDDDDKLRGPGRDYLFINEVNLCTYAVWQQLIMRTRKKSIIDYNPSDEYHWVYDKIIPRPDTKFIQSCYLDNYKFLPKKIIHEIERLKDTDPNMWKIYGLGEVAQATNVIYKNFDFYDYDVSGDTVYGLDFGFNHPASLMKITNRDGELYLENMIYDTGLTNKELIKLIKNLGITHQLIYCDAAEPKSIQDLIDEGLNAVPADKGPHSVKAGIDFLKGFKLHIRKNSVSTIKEIKSYKWKEDKNGRIFDEPIKFNDHDMDSFRYAGYTHGKLYWSSYKMALPTIKSNSSSNSFRSQLNSLRG